MEVRILGIAAPHRPGRRNTVVMLEEALRAAETVSGVKTELINIWGKKINFCTGCDACMGRGKAWGKGEVREELFGCTIKDDMQELLSIFLSRELDGVIFATPVHILGMSSRLKTFIDRLRPVVHQGTLRWAVGAVLSVAYLPIGGQESSNIDVYMALRGLGVISAGFAWGGVGVSGPAVGGPAPWDDHHPRFDVQNDKWGISTAHWTGRNVAEIAKIVKLGRQAMPPEEFETFIKSFHRLPKIFPKK
ncbi:MAG: flavodoxin family protein [Candidatus Tectomicrobia bacterium]|uniref:Flavodoxin family protein n=1 Tax=Tectimicrobiota bacterium TaxID=2528274 RepID=A0A933GP49_UNCTE|nr:flavodoxin family protein [Candidatus Tectomicrobia bacterium]